MKEKLWNEFKDALMKAAANTIAGGALVVLVYCLVPTSFITRLSDNFDKYVQAQGELNKTIINHLKAHEAAEHDSSLKK